MATTKNAPKASSSVEEGKTCAVLSYLLLGIIWYFVDEKMKKNEFVNFHVKQAIILLIVSLVGSMALGVTFIFFWLIPLWNLAILVMVVIGIYNAMNGDKKELPIIGKFANKIKI